MIKGTDGFLQVAPTFKISIPAKKQSMLSVDNYTELLVCIAFNLSHGHFSERGSATRSSMASQKFPKSFASVLKFVHCCGSQTRAPDIARDAIRLQFLLDRS